MTKIRLFCVLAFSLPFLLSACNQKPKSPAAESTPAVVDRIVLTNGGAIQGKVIDESQDMVRIEMDGGIVGFQRSEIESIEHGAKSPSSDGESNGIYVPSFKTESENDWRAGVEHRVLLKNGEWVNGRITKKTNQAFTVRQQLEGGGAIELDLDLNRIEKIELWPPKEDDPARLAPFQEQYPTLKRIQKGYYTILSSEQDPADLNFYLKRLDQIYHDFLTAYFELIDLSRPHDPLDVIIFGTRAEFEGVLKEIGYNEKSALTGFYHFNEKKLVFYNIRTHDFIQKELKETRRLQSLVNDLGQQAARSETGQIHGVSGGTIDMAADELGREELRIMSEATGEVAKVIRHEGGHQLFHLTGITPFGVYAGGWLIEGLATYSETDPIGEPHEHALMVLRFELEKNELMPLEYLLNFALGTSFHKLDPMYARLAYAQSWAFTHFLMHGGYKEAFFNFLKEYRGQGADYDSAAEKKLLEKHLGKDLKTIEAEFSPYIKKLIQETVDEKVYEDYRLRLIAAS